MCKVKREIGGFLFLALVIITLLCLVTYSPDDPGLHKLQDGGLTFMGLLKSSADNAFGVVGACVAGVLLMCLGVGALWIPVILLIAGLRLLRAKKEYAWLTSLTLFIGAIILIAATSALFNVFTEHARLFGTEYATGGILGLWLKHLLVMFLNVVGAVFILIVLWLVAFMMVTNVSFVKVLSYIARCVRITAHNFNLWLIKRRERRKKTMVREQNIKVAKVKEAEKKPIQIQQAAPKDVKAITPKPKQEKFEFMEPPTPGGPYKLPSISLLVEPPLTSNNVDEDNLRALSGILESKLADFGVNGQVVAVYSGPVITTFEYEPAPGVKINKIVNLADDLALVLRAGSIRIVAPIPGKAAIGVEVPNINRETVYFREIVGSDSFTKSKSPLTLCLGKDIVGEPVSADLAKMPHLLIAGATGTGKSVALNAMICSLLYKSTPAEVQFIMVDPKRIELSAYDGIPHLVTPVVTDAKKATNALFWAVKEMENRYELLAKYKCRNIGQFNTKVQKDEHLPDEDGSKPEMLSYIVIIIDELADLMMVASKDVEVALMRLAQMARACGIHLILATQRPSVDVLTGIIKANFPTRLTFQVSSKTDSRTIIDSNGAENLLGNGDMLYLGPGTAKLARVHGAYLSDEELNDIIEYVKSQGEPDYIEDITSDAHNTGSGNGKGSDDGETEYDAKYDEALALVVEKGQASASMIQRYLRIGYNRAQRIIEVMEQEGVVGPHKGASKPREVLIQKIHQDE